MDAVDEDGNPENLVVDVTAKLYWWEFEYPDLGIVTAQEFVVPMDEKVYFNLTCCRCKALILDSSSWWKAGYKRRERQ